MVHVDAAVTLGWGWRVVDFAQARPLDSKDAEIRFNSLLIWFALVLLSFFLG